VDPPLGPPVPGGEAAWVGVGAGGALAGVAGVAASADSTSLKSSHGYGMGERP
jgi:hypothetical protein